MGTELFLALYVAHSMRIVFTASTTQRSSLSGI